MQALLKLIATRPQLLAEHAQAYADLVAAEWPRTTAAWKRRATLYGLALLGLLAGLILAGVALMLWAALPAAPMPAAWLLVLVPLVPAAVAVACLLAARRGVEHDGIDVLQQQVQADLQLLRDATAA